MQSWIVLYVRGGRIASIELTDENLAYLKERFCLSLIQKDTLGGTEHYNVLGEIKRKRQTAKQRSK